MKELEFKGTEVLALVICCIIVMTLPHIAFYRILYQKDEYIKQLEQNNAEQAEEKQVYINRCKMLEDMLEESGLVVDDCECN